MKKQSEKLLGQTFDEYAEREIPANLDLWSRIQQNIDSSHLTETTSRLNLNSSISSSKETRAMVRTKPQRWALNSLALVAVLAIFLIAFSIWLTKDTLINLANQPTVTKSAVSTITPTVSNSSLITPTVTAIVSASPTTATTATTITTVAVVLPTVTLNPATTNPLPTTTNRPASTATARVQPTSTPATSNSAAPATVKIVTPPTEPADNKPKVYISTVTKPDDKPILSGSGFAPNTIVNIYADAVPPYDVTPLAAFTTDSKGEFYGSLTLPTYNFPTGVFYIDARLRASTTNPAAKITVLPATFLVAPTYKNTASLKASSSEAKPQKVTLTGSGYPANTEVQITGGSTVPNDYYGVVLTDKQGNFGIEVELIAENLTSGYYFITIRGAGQLYEATVSFGSIQIQPGPTATSKPLYTPTPGIPVTAPAGVVTPKFVTPTPMPTYNPALPPAIFVEGARGSMLLRAGEYFSVSGDRLPANTVINIFVDTAPPYDKTPLATPTTDANGRFRLDIIFPSYTFAPGIFYIDPKVRATSANPSLKIYNRQPGWLVSAEYKNTASLKASSTSLKAAKVILTGSGYPPNTELEITGGVQNQGKFYGTVISDKQGQFAVQVELDPGVASYNGFYILEVKSPDYLYGARVKLE